MNGDCDTGNDNEATENVDWIVEEPLAIRDTGEHGLGQDDLPDVMPHAVQAEPHAHNTSMEHEF